MSAWWSVLVAVALLGANAVFVAVEFALLSARRTRLEQMAEDKVRGANQALRATRKLTLMLAGSQLGITACSLGLGAVAEPALAEVLSHWVHTAGLSKGASHALALTVALAAVTLCHLVVGEMAPKTWSMADPEKAAARLGGPIWWFCTLVRPAIWFLAASSNAVVRLLGVEPQGELAAAHSSADLLMMLRDDDASRELGVDASSMLARSIELGGLQAHHAMTPRRDVVWVPAGADIAEVARTMRDSGRSRLVVGDGDMDHVLGVVHVKDVLAADGSTWPTTTAGDLVREVPVTHEHHRLEDLLAEMRSSRSHLTVVVDEHGAVAGVVTLEDVVEELIGEFADESDTVTSAWRRDGERTWVVAGSMRPDELAALAAVELPHGGHSTVAGYLIDALDRIPQVGEHVDVPGARLTAVCRDGYAVVEVAVEVTGQDVGRDTASGADR